MIKYILALDQGTTSSRSLLVNESGEIMGSSQRELKQYFPKSGWVEHDAEEIYETQLSTLLETIEKSYIKETDVLAIGITNQRETIVIWDKATGKPIHNAIVWQDRRTSDFCDILKEKGLEEEIRNKTGLPIDAYFSASKVNWMLDNIEGARESAVKGELILGTIDSWLVWKMTKGASHITDMTNASRTMLFNIQTLEWDEELLSIFDIPISMLPKVKPSSSGFGFFKLNGISIPITGIAGDQQAALFGQGCLNKGDIKNTYGTGCFLLMNQGIDFTLSDHGLVTTLACSTEEKAVYALEGSVFIAGAAIQWLRDGLEIIESAEETQKMAESIDEDEVIMVPAFVGLGTPYWDMHARGAVFGLTRDTGRNHFARAALQSMAFQTKDVVEAMILDGGSKPKSLKVDGGATANEYLMQFQSDILDVKIIRASNPETTALGAAYLAGLQVGLWKLEDIAEFASSGKSFTSRMSAKKREKLYSNWKKAISRTLGWLKD